jgi:ribosomal protein L32E
MQDFEEFLRRHSRRHLSLERKNSQHKGSDSKLRRRSQGRSNVKLELTAERQNRSTHHNNLSTPTLKKDISSGFIRGKSLYK